MRDFADLSPDQWLVSLAGLALVFFIIWFFWGKAGAGTRARKGESGFQEVLIIVKGGYTPDTIVVRHAVPVRLNFRREETASCSEMVLFPDFAKSAHLPPGETVALEFLPEKPGEYGFQCQMGMLKGRLIVE